MFTLVTFIVSLFLIILLFMMKGLEIYYGRRVFLERQLEKFDAWIHKTKLRLKYWWSHVNFKNTKRVCLWLADHLHRTAVALKRRFDHKQSNFFAKRETGNPASKRSVSFFLKDVSDYKKSLREQMGNHSD